MQCSRCERPALVLCLSCDQETSRAFCGVCDSAVHPLGCYHCVKPAGDDAQRFALDLEYALWGPLQPRARMTEPMNRLAHDLRLSDGLREPDTIEDRLMACRYQPVSSCEQGAVIFAGLQLSTWVKDIAISICTLWGDGMVWAAKQINKESHVTFHAEGVQNAVAASLMGALYNAWLDEFEPCSPNDVETLGGRGAQRLRIVVGGLIQRRLV